MTKVSSLPKTETIEENDSVVISTGGGLTKLASTNALASTISGSVGAGVVVDENGVNLIDVGVSGSNIQSWIAYYYPPARHICIYEGNNIMRGLKLSAGTILLGCGLIEEK